MTAQVQEALRDSGVESGLCVVYCPHTTAGVTINENADPDVTRDLMLALDKTFPDRTEFRHAEGNSAAHLKPSVWAAASPSRWKTAGCCLGCGRGSISRSSTAHGSAAFMSRCWAILKRKMTEKRRQSAWTHWKT